LMKEYLTPALATSLLTSMLFASENKHFLGSKPIAELYQLAVKMADKQQLIDELLSISPLSVWSADQLIALGKESTESAIKRRILQCLVDQAPNNVHLKSRAFSFMAFLFNQAPQQADSESVFCALEGCGNCFDLFSALISFTAQVEGSDLQKELQEVAECRKDLINGHKVFADLMLSWLAEREEVLVRAVIEKAFAGLVAERALRLDVEFVELLIAPFMKRQEEGDLEDAWEDESEIEAEQVEQDESEAEESESEDQVEQDQAEIEAQAEAKQKIPSKAIQPPLSSQSESSSDSEEQIDNDSDADNLDQALAALLRAKGPSAKTQKNATKTFLSKLFCLLSTLIVHDLPKNNVTLLLEIIPRINHLIKRIVSPHAPVTLEHLKVPASGLAKRFYSSKAVIQAFRNADACKMLEMHQKLLADEPIVESVPLVDCLVRGVLSTSMNQQQSIVDSLSQRYVEMLQVFVAGEANSSSIKQLVPLISGLLAKFASVPAVSGPLRDWLGGRLAASSPEATAADWTRGGTGIHKYRTLKVIEWATLLKCCCCPPGRQMPKRCFEDAQVQAAYSKLIRQ
jgi:hypothetical protein